MIDQTAQRTMRRPGEGIIPRGQPTGDFNEYPKMMTHPAYQPGRPTEPIQHKSGFTYHGIGTPIRFPPVLVKNRADEEYHAAQGYQNPVKCDAAAFDRAVGAGMIPDAVVYKPLEYPKWVQGKLCNDKAAEDAWVAQCNGSPATAIEALTTPQEIKDAVLDEIETREEKIARMKRELAELEVEASPADTEIKAKPVKKAAPKKKKPAALNDDQKRARSEAIKAGMARRREQQANELDGIPESQR